MNIKQVILGGIFGVVLQLGAATPEISNVVALQHCQSNGLVDVTVTMQGVSNDVARAVCTFVATNGATKAAIPVAHIMQNGDVAGEGTIWTRKFIWDAKADVGEVKIEEVELTVVVDLSLGGVQLWEGGPYWAECNVGATKPGELGYYFWWGDTVGYERVGDSWDAVDGSRNGFSFSPDNCLTYEKSESQLLADGYIDSSGNLVAAHDAATAHLGDPWRMPTDAEFRDLISECDMDSVFMYGAGGCLVKGRGAYSSKRVFFPAADYGNRTSVGNPGSNGSYWSSSFCPYLYDAWVFVFHSERYFNYSCDARFFGLSVRAVRGAVESSAATTHLSIDCAKVGRIKVLDVTARQHDASNGLVDIVVTMNGFSNDVSNADCLFFATNVATKAAIPVEHVTRNGDDTGSGTTWTRKFIWDAKADAGEVKIDDVALTVVVDLSLGGVQLWENGPCWAECNVGATKPEEYGYYFWWGDAIGYKRSIYGWLISVKDSSQLFFSSGNCPTYDMDNSLLYSEGYIDSTGNLAAAHDAATVDLGGPWRMPTGDEFLALVNNCQTTWTTCNGVNGRMITGKGAYSSKSIFLPAAGSVERTEVFDLGSRGRYWSSSPTSGFPKCTEALLFDASGFSAGSNSRYAGQPIRPVRESATSMADGATIHVSLDFRAQQLPDGGPYAGLVDGETWLYSFKLSQMSDEFGAFCCLQNGEIEVGPGGRETGKWAVAPAPTGAVAVPQLIDGYTVVTLGCSAFEDSELTSVSLPNTIRYLGGWCLSGCKKLESVSMPDSVVLVGDKAFDGCSKLNGVRLSKNVEYISWHAFDGCVSLTSICLPDSLKSIGEGAFADCGSLKTLYVSASHEARLVEMLRESGFDVSSALICHSDSGDAFPVVSDRGDIFGALSICSDQLLTSNIDNALTYDDFREWAMKLGAAEVKASPFAWASFATDSEALLAKMPTDEDLKIEEFKPSATAGSFDFMVSVRDVTIGDKVSEENLKKLFGLEGAESLDSAAFSSENVALDFKEPQDGKLRFTAKPAIDNAKSFFMKAKVK